jgi:hypothetical protein
MIEIKIKESYDLMPTLDYIDRLRLMRMPEGTNIRFTTLGGNTILAVPMPTEEAAPCDKCVFKSYLVVCSCLHSKGGCCPYVNAEDLLEEL